LSLYFPYLCPKEGWFYPGSGIMRNSHGLEEILQPMAGCEINEGLLMTFKVLVECYMQASGSTAWAWTMSLTYQGGIPDRSKQVSLCGIPEPPRGAPLPFPERRPQEEEW
jgi:hypothetical protein